MAGPEHPETPPRLRVRRRPLRLKFPGLQRSGLSDSSGQLQRIERYPAVSATYQSTTLLALDLTLRGEEGQTAMTSRRTREEELAI